MKINFFKKKKVIYRPTDSRPYLIRWNLFECPWFSIKIHKILISDDDCMHDHPWAFISLILRGGYIEHRHIKIIQREGFKTHSIYKDITKIYHPLNILYRKAEDIHRLEIHQPATSLVITFRKTRQWGFWNPLGFIPFYDYEKSHCE